MYNKLCYFSKSCVTIGSYDGVHSGHVRVLERLLAKSKELGLPSVVICIDDDRVVQLMSLREKLQVLQNMQIDYVIRLRLDATLAEMSAEKFIKEILVDTLNARYIIVGDDFYFGHKRVGDFALLEKYSKQYGYQAEVLPAYKIHGMRVSSSLIRTAVEHSNFDVAKQFLGRPYQITGKVVKGKQLGRQLGFPTANLNLPRRKLLLSGVYAVKVYGLNEHEYFGICNVDKIVEVYIFDFAADIYGKRITVEFLHKIRDEKKFATVADLVTQIKDDIERAKQNNRT